MTIDIQAVNVHKRFPRSNSAHPRSLKNMRQWDLGERHWALQGVSAELEVGGALGLIGTNGSGKSTFLRLLAGLTQPTSGTVKVRRRLTSLLMLGEGFNPMLSGEENAITGAILSGLPKKEARRRIAAVAEFAELEDRIDQPLRTFSDGMRTRLAFAVAVQLEPEIMLMDEILAVGDSMFQQKCLARLKNLQDQGVTIVLASHDLAQVRSMCQKAIWLNNGVVASEGAADHVVQEYERGMQERMPAVGRPVHQEGAITANKQVEIGAVRVLDGAGRSAPSLYPGERAFVSIDYITHAPVNGAIFSVSLHTGPTADRCFEVTTESEGPHTYLTGPGNITLELDRLDLRGGFYHVAVGIYDPAWAYQYDYAWEAATFEVPGSEAIGGFVPPHRWKWS